MMDHCLRISKQLAVVALTICFTSLLSIAAHAGDKLHLFMLSGQSNMAGLNPALSFTPAVKKALGAKNVIVVKSAQGGQPIRRWYKAWKPGKTGAPAKKADTALYDKLMDATRKALGSRKPDTITFVWMQGERDAKEMHDDVYAESLVGLIDQIKADMNHQDLNVVIGRLSDAGKTESWENVRRAQVKVAEDEPRGAWVDTDDLNGPGNKVHYTKPEGYKILGERFAGKAIALIGKE